VKYSEARLGRVLVVRLEDGDIVNESIEAAARSAGVERAVVIFLGGVDRGSRLIVGPQDGAATPVVPMERVLGDVHEAAGVGTIFPDDAGRPRLHLHAALGRDDKAVAGCTRRGVVTWVVGEAVVVELTGSDAGRVRDAQREFDLLEP
jgi:predicted DNA-binding protein with PD1-like motif